MKVLSIDIGGTHVKILLSGEMSPRKTATGHDFTPDQLIKDVASLAKGWDFDVISIGFPAPIHNNLPVAEPINLGGGWVGFDYEKAFMRPVKMINDAAMQALGSYKGGKMLFLGLGTGLGSAVVTDQALLPLELGHLPFKKKTFEDYVCKLRLTLNIVHISKDDIEADKNNIVIFELKIERKGASILLSRFLSEMCAIMQLFVECE